MDKDNLKTLLENGIVDFTFEKLNGEERKARGSRKLYILYHTPESGFTEDNLPTTSRKQSDEACAYWDFDKQDWRCVRFDSIISIDRYITEEQLFGKKLFE